MNTLRYFFLLLVFCAVSQAASAQVYSSAVGLRFGYPWSVSYKTFLDYENAIEVYAGIRGYGSFGWVTVNAAYQIHNDIPDLDGLQWYYGGGAGVQFWNYDFLEDSSTTLSVSGYLGLQYTLVDIPLSLSLDWVPTLFIGRNRGPGFNSFGAGFGALSARYVLGR